MISAAMDSIFYSAEDVIDVAEFFKTFQAKLASVESDLRDCLQNQEDLESLEANVVCTPWSLSLDISLSNNPLQDVELLSNPADVRVDPVDLLNIHAEWGTMHSISVPKRALSLNCVKERVNRWSSTDRLYYNKKYRCSRFVQPKSETEPQAITCEIKPMSEVLVTIRALVPFRYNSYKRNPLKLDKEIVFLGSQYLHELRDMITCECDTKGPFVDISRDPSADVRSDDQYADKSNSGFLFIGDTFYNDMRREGNLNYSKEIIEWAKKQPGVKELHQASIEGKRFLDLERVHVGSAYLYTHFGECEHVFLISDLRIITAADNLVRSDYPYLHLMGRSRNVICDMCGIYEVNYLVKDSVQHIFDPVRLCAKCLNSYHYVDGKKQGNFTVYKYSSGKNVW